MEIIDELEKHPRGIYTGAIGYFSPDQYGVFNVPIRTVVLENGKAEMGIGSGIIADSSPRQEWDECLLKAEFLTNPAPQFDLIETLFYHCRDGCLFLQNHLQRIETSAAYFDYSFSRAKIQAELKHFCKGLDEATGHRLRILLRRDGTLTFSSVSCDPPKALEFPEGEYPGGDTCLKIDFATETTDSKSPYFFHKTTMRKQYDSAYENGVSAGLFDVIFCNEKMEVTEGCISNLFILKDGSYYTPPVSCGLLDGIMRKHLLTTDGRFRVSERVLSRKDICEADGVFVCNSVRGVLRVHLATG